MIIQEIHLLIFLVSAGSVGFVIGMLTNSLIQERQNNKEVSHAT